MPEFPEAILNLAIWVLLFSMALMLLTWVISVRYRFFSIVDVAWSYSFGLLALIFLVTAPGAFPRRALLASIFVIWSFRLATYLLMRLLKHFPDEDGRYLALKNRWKKRPHFSFFIFFLSQALSVVLLSTPLLFPMVNESPELHPLEYLGAALLLLTVVGEAIADKQLDNFRKNPASKGRVCDVGLWKYSRHPNYFFEWLNWVSFFIFACASPWGFISILSPTIILYLLFKVTGIPATEAQAIRSRGEAYKDYQRRTSVFFPWFPKKE